MYTIHEYKKYTTDVYQEGSSSFVVNFGDTHQTEGTANIVYSLHIKASLYAKPTLGIALQSNRVYILLFVSIIAFRENRRFKVVYIIISATVPNKIPAATQDCSLLRAFGKEKKKKNSQE